MSITSQISTKIRNVVNRVVRPSAVTAAQHRHVHLFPNCAACGSTNGVQGHHRKPFNKFPALAADPDNFLSLCEGIGGLECHLHLGHSGNFRFYNPDVDADVVAFSSASEELRKTILVTAATKRQVDEP